MPASHPGFAGHFPAEPILPGVVQLDIVVGALAARLGDSVWVSGIPVLRFRRAVRPGDLLEVLLRGPDASGAVSFELQCEQQVVSNGRLQVEWVRP